MEEYRDLQEKFVANHTGTSVLEISVVLSVPVVSVFLRRALLLAFHIHAQTSFGQPSFWKIFMIDFPCLVLPTLLSATTHSESLYFLFFSVLMVAIGSIVWKCYRIPNLTWKYAKTRVKDFPTIELDDRFQFISNFKAYTLIGTVISILAVDFTVFPRRFCKTETYGTGLMDAGVGLFVVSNAVVSPEARNKMIQGQNRFYQVYKSILSSLPLLVLGLARVITTKGVNYQEHATEYGTHWNFFFTLAAVKGIDGQGGRHGILDSNREGIISNVGYFIMYLFGVEIGRLVFNKERKIVSDYMNLLAVLVVSAASLFTVLPYLTQIEPISRRFTNVPYVIWMVYWNMFTADGFLFVNRFDLPLSQKFTKQKRKRMAEGFTSVPEMELQKSLNVFYTSYGHLTRSKVLPEVVETAYAVLQKIQETSEMFKGEVVKVGSSASKVSTMLDDESDVLFPISIEGLIEATKDPEFVKFKLMKRCVKIWEICSDNEYLSPSKFSDKFYDLIKDCLEKMNPDGKIELEGKGTVAATLNCCHEKFDFSVDLVPAVRCKPWSTHPYWIQDKTRHWPPRELLATIIERGTELVSKSSRDGGNNWRLSFSHAETELVTSATSVFPIFALVI
ncbi:PIGW [Mytilus edulis]|uniref:PIGW n=1 Tax=Mytilus edulis TaxID=6550 RepID=A0A8S3TA13_MYTED|nr:PIGW [Mytilus edulis]